MKETISLIATLIYTCLIFVRATHVPNPAVLDSSGNPVRRGEKYFIRTTTSERNNPMVTLINRTTSSHQAILSVGLEEDVSVFSSGLPLVFSPFVSGEKVVRENKSFKILFSNSERGKSVLAWKVGLKDPKNNKRFIVTGDNVGYSNYFYVKKLGQRNAYGLGWCPAEICGACKLICSDVTIFVENKKRFFTLDGDSVLPIVFVKA